MASCPPGVRLGCKFCLHGRISVEKSARLSRATARPGPLPARPGPKGGGVICFQGRNLVDDRARPSSPWPARAAGPPGPFTHLPGLLRSMVSSWLDRVVMRVASSSFPLFSFARNQGILTFMLKSISPKTEEAEDI